MTRREALIAIRDLVERGEWVGDWSNLDDAGIAHQSHGHFCGGWAYNAFRGDLSAGIALLQHVLPGWDAQITLSNGFAEIADGPFFESFSRRHEGVDANLARALLLAILEALIAKEGER